MGPPLTLISIVKPKRGVGSHVEKGWDTSLSRATGAKWRYRITRGLRRQLRWTSTRAAKHKALQQNARKQGATATRSTIGKIGQKPRLQKATEEHTQKPWANRPKPTSSKATGDPSPYLALLAHKRRLPTPLLNVARRSASAAAGQVTVPAPAAESRTAQGSGVEAAGPPFSPPAARASAPASSAPPPSEHVGPVQPSPWTCGELAALQAGGDRPLAFGTVAVGFSSMQLASFLCPCVRFATFGDVLSRLPEAARASICSLLDTPGGPQGSALHCYVDGSYTPASADAPALMGWACVFVLPEPIRISIVAGSFPEWFDLAAWGVSAFAAECVALTVWVLQC